MIIPSYLYNINIAYSKIFTSVLRLSARPSAVVFSAMGTVIPYPFAVILSGAIPLLKRYALTVLALLVDNIILASGLPTLSV
jgi:hypothetical protein